MKKKICPVEREITAGLKEKKLEPDLQRHISECSVCKDVIAVHTWMNQFKEAAWKTDMPKKGMPNAETIWDRAYAWKKPDREVVKKALRPLIYPQILSFCVCLAGIIFLGTTGVLKFGDIFDNPAITRILPFFLLFTSIIVISIVFCALLLALEKRNKTI